MNSDFDRNKTQAGLLLARLGFRRSTKAVLYLTTILAECPHEVPRGPALWEKYAQRFDTRPVNLQSAIRLEVRRAYRRDPTRLSELAGLGEVLFTPPRPREFILLAARWLRENEFVWDEESGWAVRPKPKERDGFWLTVEMQPIKNSKHDFFLLSVRRIQYNGK